MVAYVLDALRQKEGAFAAIWVTLGAVNLTLIFTAAAFPQGRPIILGLCVMVANGATLLLAGECNRLHVRHMCMINEVTSLLRNPEWNVADFCAVS